MNAEHAPASRSADRTEARRNQVLDAARQCFKRDGFDGASMADICKTAGMSAGHVYNFFSSKNEIIEAIVERDLQVLRGRIANISEQPDLLAALVLGIRNNLCDDYNGERRNLQLEVLAAALREPCLADRVHANDHELTARVSLILMQRLGISSEQATIRAELIGALYDGLMVRSVRNPRFDIERLMALVEPMLKILLQPPGVAPPAGGGAEQPPHR